MQYRGLRTLRLNESGTRTPDAVKMSYECDPEHGGKRRRELSRRELSCAPGTAPRLSGRWLEVGFQNVPWVLGAVASTPIVPRISRMSGPLSLACTVCQARLARETGREGGRGVRKKRKRKKK